MECYSKMHGLKKESTEMVISIMEMSGSCKKMEPINISNAKMESVKKLLIKEVNYQITSEMLSPKMNNKLNT